MKAPRTTDARTDAPRPPVITLGRYGSGILSIDSSVEGALAHLNGHVAEPASAVVLDDLLFFDAAGHQLRLDPSGDVVRLVVADGLARRGEVCARIDEVLAHARAEAHRAPSLLQDTAVASADSLASPTGGDLDDYLEALTPRLCSVIPPDQHLGGWWHNLLHRIS